MPVWWREDIRKGVKVMVYAYEVTAFWEGTVLSFIKPSIEGYEEYFNEHMKDKMVEEFGSHGHECNIISLNTRVSPWKFVFYLPPLHTSKWKLNANSTCKFESDIPLSPIDPLLIGLITTILITISRVILAYFLLEGLKVVKTIITGVEKVNGTVVTSGGAWIDEEGNVHDLPAGGVGGSGLSANLLIIIIGVIVVLFLLGKRKD